MKKINFPSPMISMVEIFASLAIIFFVLNMLLPKNTIEVFLPEKNLPISKDINFISYKNSLSYIYNKDVGIWERASIDKEVIFLPLQNDYNIPLMRNSKIEVIISGDLLNSIAKLNLLTSKSKSLTNRSLKIYLNSKGSIDIEKTIQKSNI